MTTPKTPEPPRGPWKGNTRFLRDYVRKHLRETHSAETLTGITKTKPDLTTGTVTVIRQLDGAMVGDRRVRIYCALCETEEKFHHGAVTLWSDGFLRTIGKDCASKPEYLGRQITELEWAKQEALQLREDTIDRLQHVLPFAGMLLEEIDQLNSLVKARDQFSAELFADLPALHDALKGREGIVMHRKRTNRERDIARQMGDHSPYTEDWRHTLAGANVLKTGLGEKHYAPLVQALRHLQTTRVESLEGKSQAELDSILGRLSGAIPMADTLLQTLRGPIAFIASDVPRIVPWANSPLNSMQDRYTVLPRGIKRESHVERKAILAEGYAVPTLQTLPLLKRALEIDLELVRGESPSPILDSTPDTGPSQPPDEGHLK